MAGNSTIGKVSVKIWPDTRKFREEAEAGLRKETANGVDIAVNADITKFVAQVEAAKKAVERDATKIHVKVDPDSNKSLMRNIAKIDRELDKLREDVEFDVSINEADLMDARNALNEHMAVEMRVDKKSLDSVRKAISQIDAEMDKLHEVDMRVIINEKSLEDARAKLEKSARQMEADIARRTQLKLNAKIAEDNRVGSAIVKQIEQDLSKLKFHAKFDEAAQRKAVGELESLLHKRRGLLAESMTPSMDPIARRKLNQELGQVDDAIQRIHEGVRDVNNDWRRQHLLITRSHNRLVQFGDLVDKMGRGLGRLSGEGSRNNFLNIFGRRIGGLARTLALPIRTIDVLVGTISAGVQQFHKLADAGASTGKALLGAFGESAKFATNSIFGLVSAIGAAVVGFASLALLAPMVSMLAGAVVALASSIAIALVGAIAPLIPLLGAMAIGLGVAAVAFIPLIDDIKEGKGEFRAARREIDNLKGAINALGKEAAPVLGSIAERMIEGATNLTKSMSGAINAIWRDFDANLQSPKMDKFYDQWANKMPGIVEKFGKGLNSLAFGLIAYFTPVLDIADELAGSFQRAMDRFKEWAQSATGQNEIAAFFYKAWDRAKSLWKALGDLGDALGNIMSIADQEAGHGFLDSIADLMERFEKWTRKPIKLTDMIDMTGAAPGTLKASGVPMGGRSALQEFFDDVDTFTRNLEGAVTGIADFFEELNNPKNRRQAEEFAKNLSTIAGALEEIARVASFTAELLGKIDWSSVTRFIMGDLMSGIKEGIRIGFEGLPDSVKQWARAAFQAIITVGKELLGINSPSTVMIAMMGDVGAGIIIGLAAIPGQILQAVLAIPAAIVNGIGMGLQAFAPSIMSGMQPGVVQAGVSASSLVGGATNVIGTLGGAAWGALSDLGGKIVSRFTGAQSQSDAQAQSLVSSASGLLGNLPGDSAWALRSLPGVVGGKVGEASTSANSEAVTMVEDVSSTIYGLIAQTTLVLADLPIVVGGIAREAMQGMVAAFRSGTLAARSALRGIPFAIRWVLGPVPGMMFGYGLNISHGLANGIRAGLGAAANAAASLANIAARAVRAKLAIRSPSRVFMQIGNYVVQGFTRGMDAGRRHVGDAAARLSAEALNSINTGPMRLADTGSAFGVGSQMALSLADGFEAEMVNVEKRLTDATRNLALGVSKGLTGTFQGQVEMPKATTASGAYRDTRSSGDTKVLNYYAGSGSSDTERRKLFDTFKRM